MPYGNQRRCQRIIVPRSRLNGQKRPFAFHNQGSSAGYGYNTQLGLSSTALFCLFRALFSSRDDPPPPFGVNRWRDSHNLSGWTHFEDSSPMCHVHLQRFFYIKNQAGACCLTLCSDCFTYAHPMRRWPRKIPVGRRHPGKDWDSKAIGPELDSDLFEYGDAPLEKTPSKYSVSHRSVSVAPFPVLCSQRSSETTRLIRSQRRIGYRHLSRTAWELLCTMHRKPVIGMD